MEYLLAAAGILFLVFLTGKCKRLFRRKWSKLLLEQDRTVMVLRVQNLEQQIEGLLRELVTWRGYQAPQLELVVVDLDSSDHSRAILERLNTKWQNFYLLSRQAYDQHGLTSLGLKVAELVVLELNSESDYSANLHKLKKVLTNLAPARSKLGQQVFF